jgi:hypothetical protein
VVAAQGSSTTSFMLHAKTRYKICQSDLGFRPVLLLSGYCGFWLCAVFNFLKFANMFLSRVQEILPELNLLGKKMPNN